MRYFVISLTIVILMPIFNLTFCYADIGVSWEKIEENKMKILHSPMPEEDKIKLFVQNYLYQLILNKQYTEVINSFEKYPDLIIEKAFVYNSRGSQFFESGNFSAALNDFNEAIILDNLFSDAFFNRASLYDEIDSLELAKKDISEAIRLSPKNEDFKKLKKYIDSGGSLKTKRKNERLKKMEEMDYFIENYNDNESNPIIKKELVQFNDYHNLFTKYLKANSNIDNIFKYRKIRIEVIFSVISDFVEVKNITFHISDENQMNILRFQFDNKELILNDWKYWSDINIVKNFPPDSRISNFYFDNIFLFGYQKYPKTNISDLNYEYPNFPLNDVIYNFRDYCNSVIKKQLISIELKKQDIIAAKKELNKSIELIKCKNGNILKDYKNHKGDPCSTQLNLYLKNNSSKYSINNIRGIIKYKHDGGYDIENRQKEFNVKFNNSWLPNEDGFISIKLEARDAFCQKDIANGEIDAKLEIIEVD